MPGSLPAPAPTVQVTAHFEARFRERLGPEASVTESALLRELLDAEFAPDDSERPRYVTIRTICGRRVALVVAVREHAFILLTIFEPTPSWWRRFAARRTVPGTLLAAAA